MQVLVSTNSRHYSWSQQRKIWATLCNTSSVERTIILHQGPGYIGICQEFAAVMTFRSKLR